MRHLFEPAFPDERPRKPQKEKVAGSRHPAVSHEVEHLIAADRPARAGSEPRVNAAKEKETGDARRRADQEGLEEYLRDAAVCAGILRPAECQPTGDTLCRAEQVIDGADGPCCQ